MIKFKQILESFIATQNRDKIRFNLDENSIFVSVGCDLNHLEAERIRTQIKNANPDYKVCVVHVCTEYSKFIELTKQVIDLVVANLPSEFKLFLTGCDSLFYQQFYPDLKIVGDNDKFKVESYEVPTKINIEETKPEPMGLIQIQVGCNNQCAYCKFPRLKGHSSSSKTKEQIVELIRENVKKGIKEIVLTGLNICQYREPNDNTGLVDLLKYLCSQNLGVDKFSMFSIDPAYHRIFELMDFIESDPLMSKDLYLATQSGSNHVLKLMNRRHTRERVLEIINYAKKIKIRHDFIIAHPGETEEDFQETVELLRMSQENEILGGIAEYYPHEGTASYYMKDKVSEHDSHRRYEYILERANKIIELTKQEVKCIQFELWHNCKNECEFCYLNGCRKVYTEHQKQQSIEAVLEILSTDKVKGYNAVGLIGGELFGPQQEDPETRRQFQQLIRKMKTFLENDEMKEVWLTSNLLTDDLTPLTETLDILLKDLPRYQRVMLCTSYDTVGRFHSEEQYNQWYSNLNKIKELFPRLCLHIQMISSQALIDEWFANKERFLDFINKGILIDLKPPATNAVDFIYHNTGREAFRANLKKFADTQSYKYLIESRDQFMEFWKDVANTFPEGVQKLKDFVTNHVKSECCYSYPWNEWFVDRWDNDKENAPCGHCWDGFSYKDYPDKCCKCDVEKLIKLFEERH